MGLNSNYSNEIIFGLSKERAFNHLSKMVQDIEVSDEEIKKLRVDMVLTNKRRIIAVPFTESTRGYRCSIAHVDIDLSIRALHENIYPIMNTGYYGKEEKSIHERVHLFNGGGIYMDRHPLF